MLWEWPGGDFKSSLHSQEQSNLGGSGYIYVTLAITMKALEVFYKNKE